MPSLDAGLLVSADHILIRLKGEPLPVALIEIQHDGCPFLKARIAWPYPTAITPGANGIGAEPTPNRCSADGSNKSPLNSLLGNLGAGQTREGQSQVLWQLAGQRLDLHNDVRGKKRGVARALAAPGARPNVRRKSACAIWRQSVAGHPTEGQCPYFGALGRQAGRPSPA